MNEKVDLDNIIEVSNTKHTKKNNDGSDDEDEFDANGVAKPKNEEEKKYHENVISDIYGDLSSEDEEDDEEETQNNLDKQIEEEAKQKHEELKKQELLDSKMSQNPLMKEVREVGGQAVAAISHGFDQLKAQPIVGKMTEKVGQMVDVTKHKVEENVNAEKVKHMFNNAYSKFNTIIEKNKVNLPQFDQILKEQKVERQTLNAYLKKQQNVQNQSSSVGNISTQSSADKNELERKAKRSNSLHFKIGDDGATSSTSSQKEAEPEGEEFSDSEDHSSGSTLQNNQEKNANIVEEEEEKSSSSSFKDANLDQNQEFLQQNIVKGQQADVTNLKLFTVKKETKKGNMLKNLVSNTETRHLALINGHLYSFQLINQPNKTMEAANQLKDQLKDQIKDIDTQKVKKSITSFFTKSKEKLISLKNNLPGQNKQQTSHNQNQSDHTQTTLVESQTNQHQETNSQILTGKQYSSTLPLPHKQMAIVRNIISLERLFMIDIFERGKREIEILMHFVNKQYNPLMSPEIKRYRMQLDADTQEFLIRFEREVSERSRFYGNVQSGAARVSEDFGRVKEIVSKNASESGAKQQLSGEKKQIKDDNKSDAGVESISNSDEVITPLE